MSEAYRERVSLWYQNVSKCNNRRLSYDGAAATRYHGPMSKVLLIDDLLATGGTALAAANLIEKLGGTVVEMAFIVNLPDVGGEKKVTGKGYSVYCLTQFKGV